MGLFRYVLRPSLPNSADKKGFAHQITWLPGLKVGFAILSNSDLGGTFLRSLLACRMIESAAGLEKKDWFKM